MGSAPWSSGTASLPPMSTSSAIRIRSTSPCLTVSPTFIFVMFVTLSLTLPRTIERAPLHVTTRDLVTRTLGLLVLRADPACRLSAVRALGDLPVHVAVHADPFRVVAVSAPDLRERTLHANGSSSEAVFGVGSYFPPFVSKKSVGVASPRTWRW